MHANIWLGFAHFQPFCIIKTVGQTSQLFMKNKDRSILKKIVSFLPINLGVLFYSNSSIWQRLEKNIILSIRFSFYHILPCLSCLYIVQYIVLWSDRSFELIILRLSMKNQRNTHLWCNNFLHINRWLNNTLQKNKW